MVTKDIAHLSMIQLALLKSNRPENDNHFSSTSFFCTDFHFGQHLSFFCGILLLHITVMCRNISKVFFGIFLAKIYKKRKT